MASLLDPWCGKIPKLLLEVVRGVPSYQGGGISFMRPCPLPMSRSSPRLFLSTPYTKEASINAVKTFVCSRDLASPADAAGASLFKAMQLTPTLRKCGSSAGIEIPKHSLVKLLHVP